MSDMSDGRPGLQGRLLVAAPVLLDPNFARTVVMLLAHSDQGALGLVLNRPTAADVEPVLPGWGGLASGPSLVFAGGPVTEGTICLARVSSEVAVPSSGYLPLNGALGTVDLASEPSEVAPWVKELRIFAGYAGWGPGQLESEIGEKAWFVVAPDDGDVFTAEPAKLWKEVLRRQGGRLAIVSALPPDPSLN